MRNVCDAVAFLVKKNNIINELGVLGGHKKRLVGPILGHSNMIHCFPFHQKARGMRAGGSLFIITIRIRAPAILTTHTKATVRQRDKSGYTNTL